jgi:hypothetical protein
MHVMTAQEKTNILPVCMGNIHYLWNIGDKQERPDRLFD